jgi:hypothetical protein
MGPNNNRNIKNQIDTWNLKKWRLITTHFRPPVAAYVRVNIRPK